MVERKRKIFLNILKNFGIFHFTVERVLKGLGNIPTSKMRSIFRKRVPFSYACYETYYITNQGKDGNGMERKRKIKDGHIVVGNPLFQELPKHEVTLKSGRTLYRFTGSYDGERSLPHKVLRLMEQEKGKKDVD